MGLTSRRGAWQSYELCLSDPPVSSGGGKMRLPTAQPQPLTEAPVIRTLKRMTIQLKPEQEHRVAEALRSGAYRSPEDVIDRALEALHEQDEWLNANRQAIDKQINTGIAELERGEGIPEDELDAYLKRLKSRPE